MRDFKEPYYTGPECVCCKQKQVEVIVKEEHERLIKKFEEADSACSPWAIAIIKGEPNE